MTKKIQLKNPCNIKWNSLKGNGSVRFCDVCSTNVIDLTNKSNKEIIELVMRSKGRVCGKIRKDQIDRIIYSKRNNTYFLKTFFVFILGFASISSMQGQNKSANKIYTEYVSQSNNTRLIDTSTKNDTTYTISGKVVDEDGVELPNANILLKGTEIGTSSNLNGEFHLNIDEKEIKKSKKIIQISYIGFKTQEIEIGFGSNNNMQITMEMDIVELGGVHFPWYLRFWWRVTSLFDKS